MQGRKEKMCGVDNCVCGRGAFLERRRLNEIVSHVSLHTWTLGL